MMKSESAMASSPKPWNHSCTVSNSSRNDARSPEATAASTRLTAFWQQYPKDFKTLAKANFIAKAIEDRSSAQLDSEQFTALMQAVGIDPKNPVTLATLKAPTRASRDIRIATLDIAGYEATDILRFVEPGGRQFMYVPGEVDGFHVFDTPDDLQWWLMTHTNEVDNRGRFMAHFALSTHAENSRQTGLHHALDLMFSHWGPHCPSLINQGNQWIAGDPFTQLRDATQDYLRQLQPSLSKAFHPEQSH